MTHPVEQVKKIYIEKNNAVFAGKIEPDLSCYKTDPNCSLSTFYHKNGNWMVLSDENTNDEIEALGKEPSGTYYDSD